MPQKISWMPCICEPAREAESQSRGMDHLALWCETCSTEDHRDPVGAENLRDQAIFVNHAPGAIAPLDPELIEIRDAVGQLP